MQVRKIYLCYFSPTQGSEKIIHAMAQSMPEAEFIDLTRETKKLNTFHSDDLLIVGAPVYGGICPL